MLLVDVDSGRGMAVGGISDGREELVIRYRCNGCGKVVTDRLGTS
jgi:transposase-like protein